MPRPYHLMRLRSLCSKGEGDEQRGTKVGVSPPAPAFRSSHRPLPWPMLASSPTSRSLSATPKGPPGPRSLAVPHQGQSPWTLFCPRCARAKGKDNRSGKAKQKGDYLQKRKSGLRHFEKTGCNPAKAYAPHSLRSGLAFKVSSAISPCNRR